MSEPREPAARVPELGVFRVGDWTACKAEGTLSSNGGSVRLEPRVMDVLAYLASESGRVVPKDEILEAVWAGAFVEEGALSQAIHSLRKALGDDARQPHYIQTVPKRGYRLVAPVVLEAPATPEPAGATVPSRSRRQTWLVLLAGALIVVILLLALRDRVATEPAAPGPGSGTRIVVLPFENMSKPEDAFFADGLTEEITKDLASLSSLQVISRTSAMQYGRGSKPLSQIGRELGVDYVLEGTVRWADGPEGRRRARITPQLIRVSDDAHVWAHAYEEEVGDIFKIQAEISRRVIGQLGIALLPEEGARLRAQPTENLEAYWSYLRGLELRNQPFYSEPHLRRAVPMFERAVELDPDFAAAWAELSQTHSYLFFNTEKSPARKEKARQALERAAALDPDLPSVRLARAYFTYRCEGDFQSAHRQLVEASRRFPNHAELLQSLGFVLRRLGRLPEAIEALRRSFSLDPRGIKTAWTIAETHRALREYEQAELRYDIAISLAPDEPYFWEEKALNRLAWKGSSEEARAILASAPVPAHALMSAELQLDLYDREYRSALEKLSPERLQAINPLDRSRLSALALIARERLEGRASAAAAARANLVELEKLEREYPDEAVLHAWRAVALAQLGRGGEAVAEAERAVREKKNDAFSGPIMVEIQAMTDAILGRRHEAVERLSWLLSRPYRSAISTTDLRLSPVWDPLRGDPGFEDLIRAGS